MTLTDILTKLTTPKPTAKKITAAQKSAAASAVETRKKLSGKFSDLPLRSIPFVHAVMRTAHLEQDYLPAAQYVASTTTNDALDGVIEGMRRDTKDEPWRKAEYEEFCAISFHLIHGKRWADIIVARTLDLPMPRQLPGTSTKQFVQDQFERAAPFVWALGSLSAGPQAGVRQATWLQQWQLRVLDNLSTPGIQQSLLIRLEEAGELGTQAGWHHMLMVSSALEIGRMGTASAPTNSLGFVPEADANTTSSYGADTPPQPTGMDAMTAEIRHWTKSMAEKSDELDRQRHEAEQRQGQLLERMRDSADKTRHDVSRMRDDMRDANPRKRKDHQAAPSWAEPSPPAGPPPAPFGSPSSYMAAPSSTYPSAPPASFGPPSSYTATPPPAPTSSCYKCRGVGHWARECPHPESCLRCGASGHKARVCEGPCMVCKTPGKGRHVGGCTNVASKRPGFVLNTTTTSENYWGTPKNVMGQ